MTAPARTRGQLLVVAEAALVLLTLAAVVGLGRLFADGSFLPPVLPIALAAHALAIGCRRAGLGPAPTLAVAIGGLVLVVSWLQLGETTALGIPTGETWTQARAELSEAWRLFGDVKAPAPVEPGFVLACSVGVWLIAFTADTAAFRAGAVAEAVVPAAALFVFGGALGGGAHRTVTTALFLGTGLAYWLAQRSLDRVAAPTWLTTDARSGTRALLRTGAVLALVGVVAAVTIGPRLPGAEAQAVVPWRATDRDDPASRVTISPLVDIRTRLVDQADLEAFRVVAEERSYWRLTSLERFDGRIWSSNRQYRPARGTLQAGVDDGAAGQRLVRQAFTIVNLATIWLPAAFRPVTIEGTDARYDRDSNSLLTEADSAVGQSYTVESVMPVLDASGLASAPAVAPSDLAETYLALPVDFSLEVQREAGRIVQGAATQYERARRLQDHFRDGSFTYDLSVPAGHSGNDLEHFLFRSRRGYCEQFAGAYAAMARAVGLPARVAVGFTPGELGPDGAYVVRGFNGHAWPEVYLDGYGWVPFEPTPGRGIPNGESWTGVPEAQAEPGNPQSATTVPTTTPTTAAGGEAAPTTAPPTGFPEDPLPDGSEQDDGSSWLAPLLALLAVVLVPLSWVGVLAAVRVLRRRRRRAAATSADDRVLVAWDEVAEALARTGTAPQPWETPAEFAARAARGGRLDPLLLTGLAGVTTAAAYGSAGVRDDVAEQAVDVAGQLERAAEASLSGRDRLRLLVDPRPLRRAREARVEVHETVGTGRG